LSLYVCVNSFDPLEDLDASLPTRKGIINYQFGFWYRKGLGSAYRYQNQLQTWIYLWIDGSTCQTPFTFFRPLGFYINIQHFDEAIYATAYFRRLPSFYLTIRLIINTKPSFLLLIIGCWRLMQWSILTPDLFLVKFLKNTDQLPTYLLNLQENESD
jgi:hypothetical protein